MKILTVLGARPQFIKAAAVSRQLSAGKSMHEIVLHTGQHFDDNMSTVFFSELEIPKPSFNLNIHSGLHGEMTGRMLEGIEKIILSEKPDVVLVYGDTNSTLAGAIAASKLHVRLVHVEAGLRSFNMNMPEEINRILTDRVSDLLCCPTVNSKQNLVKEGFESFNCRFEMTGDVMLDSALYYSSKKDPAPEIAAKAKEDFVLCTVHRAENTNDPHKIRSIIESINELHKEVKVIWPIHPRTKKVAKAMNIKISCDLIDPVGYFDILHLLKNCKMVMTDSGGLQKEAYFFKKFCLVLREETEWKELLDSGYLKLVQFNPSEIKIAYQDMLSRQKTFSENYFGNGHAAEKIVQLISAF
jgi:UDP-GlcNAc3NAcA epimerase